MILEKTRSRTLTPRPKKPHFSTKRRKPLNRKRKFHAKDNTLKAYKEKRSKEEIEKFAEDCQRLRLANPTDAEQRFEEIIRQVGIPFEREKIFYYADRFAIFDFWLPDHAIAIECDGNSHTGQAAFDLGRDTYFTKQSIKTLRFTNKQVISTPDWVAQRVMEAMDDRAE